ncbi:hypothetical protein KIL84_009355 [Mauremys mutica]|uniref:Uncharacterized protein n=1 Tax=Mauremys mutica TaxID=74926 RepID=A0A9D3XFE3_9SAUR|nr:hypothetical protein KIL84_009355 [Mauremys mutica]
MAAVDLIQQLLAGFLSTFFISSLVPLGPGQRRLQSYSASQPCRLTRSLALLERTHVPTASAQGSYRMQPMPGSQSFLQGSQLICSPLMPAGCVYPELPAQAGKVWMQSGQYVPCFPVTREHPRAAPLQKHQPAPAVLAHGP